MNAKHEKINSTNHLELPWNSQGGTRKHSVLGKTFHWGFIILYAYGIFKQIDELEELEDPTLLAFEVAFAAVFLGIVMIRYSYMRRFETFMGATEPVPIAHRYLAKGIHTSMYLCLVMLPLSGLLIAVLFTQGVKDGPLQVFSLALHEISASLSYVLIAMHVGAAIWSRVKGEGVWTSMVPIWKEEGASRNELVTRISKLENEVFNRAEKALTSQNE